MTTAELIKQLQKLPQDSDIRIRKELNEAGTKAHIMSVSDVKIDSKWNSVFIVSNEWEY